MKYEDYVWDYKDVVAYEEKIKRGTMPPVIISVAVTGGVIGKEANPNLPETPEEQADDIYACYQAGAASAHIHARDPKKGYSATTSNTEDYLKINKMVRERCPDIIINNILTGGHVRVGMEDNLFLKRGELLKSNAQMVEKVVRLAQELDRDIATPKQAREMLGISDTPSSY